MKKTTSIRLSLEKLQALMVIYPCHATKENLETLREAKEQLAELEGIGWIW